MAVEQQRIAEPVEENRQLGVDRFMVRPVRLRQPLVELLRADRTPP
jgi:hypothetical protein